MGGVCVDKRRSGHHRQPSRSTNVSRDRYHRRRRPLHLHTTTHTHTHEEEEDDPHHQNIRFITHLSRRRRLTFLHSPGGWASSSCRWDLWSRRRGSSGPPARRWPSPPSCWAPSLGTSACQPPPVTRNQEEDEEGEEEGQEEESEEEEREEHHEFR